MFERKRQFFKSHEKRKNAPTESKERERERGEKKKATIRMSSGAITRAQKRRMGQRDLWDVIVNNDDICFEHILPKLNRTDVKFLFEVNGETRALMKRSSRVGELEKSFKVSEMSSISTLEFAWENQSFWPVNGPPFCYRVAGTNILELLKWAREEKKCEWDDWTIINAAIQGNLEMVKYCVANKCPMGETSCAHAAYNGHLECLKYLHEEGNVPWNSYTAAWAALQGHLHILEYLVERKYNKFNTVVCWNAAWKGHLDCLKYLHETAKAPWDSYAVKYAHKYNCLECLRYLLDNDCPLPSGWRYEHGTLFTS